MGSWVRTITSPFRKACSSLFNSPGRDHGKSRSSTPAAGHHKTDQHGVILHGEVMACGYEDVRVMWSILDKSNHHRDRSCSGGAGF